MLDPPYGPIRRAEQDVASRGWRCRPPSIAGQQVPADDHVPAYRRREVGGPACRAFAGARIHGFAAPRALTEGQARDNEAAGANYFLRNCQRPGAPSVGDALRDLLPAALAPRPGALPLLPFAFAEDFVKQRDDAFDVVVGNVVIDGLPLSPRCHKPVEPQAAELLRDGWLAQRQSVFEFRHRAFFLGKETEKKQPCLMGEGF